MFAKNILLILFPNASKGTEMLQLSSITIIFIVLTQTINGALQGLGKVNIPVIAFALGGAIKLILNLILLPINRIGIYGAIISSIISDIFIFAICFITLKKQITTKLYVSKYIVKPTIAGVFMSITSYIMYNNIINKIQNNIIVLFVSIFSGMMVYFILIIALKILTEEEIYMLPYGQKLFRTFKSKKQQMQVKSTHTELPRHGNLRGKRVCKKIKIKKEGF